ncbi:type II toxin-antitoxin system PemK/MazF family toxin [Lactobacillus rhamnosus]|uniref:Type II toxin-antitoxin system PemK/MazF family toxin n=2 Tax=Lacticaseibacillus rhamnosus TaxID=47715 RepID=A0A7Y7QEV9_LACRH|nr:type II toxin-antitoxin system PemK/MazF family toxin [Lacticaseibacillus rhamnosus]
MDDHAMLRQGGLISINFSPSKGHEQQKHRPAVIISNNFYNSKTWMKKLLPIT